MSSPDFSKAQYRRLLALLGQEEEHVASFCELASKQTEILSAEDVDTDALMANLDMRQQLIDTIERLHQELNLLVQSYTPFAETLKEDDPVRKTVSDMQGAIQARLSEINRADKQNAEKMEALMEHYGSSGKRANLSRKSISLYRQRDNVPYGAEFFDKKQ